VASFPFFSTRTFPPIPDAPSFFPQRNTKLRSTFFPNRSSDDLTHLIFRSSGLPLRHFVSGIVISKPLFPIYPSPKLRAFRAPFPKPSALARSRRIPTKKPQARSAETLFSSPQTASSSRRRVFQTQLLWCAPFKENKRPLMTKNYVVSSSPRASCRFGVAGRFTACSLFCHCPCGNLVPFSRRLAAGLAKVFFPFRRAIS